MAIFQIEVETLERRVLEVEAQNKRQALRRYESDLVNSTEYLREVETECLDEEIVAIEKV